VSEELDGVGGSSRAETDGSPFGARCRHTFVTKVVEGSVSSVHLSVEDDSGPG
jgi:hypothetical protein